MHKSKKASAIFFMTHRRDKKYLNRYFKLRQEVGHLYDVYYAYDVGEHGRLPLSFYLKGGMPISFDKTTLPECLGYDYSDPKTGILSGGFHYPLIKFALGNKYDYYYMLEYDVCYQGNWKVFFNYFNNCSADFVSTYFLTYRDRAAHWPWWPSLKHPKLNEPLKAKIRSFNPFFRISDRALFCLHQAQKEGWNGHCEALLSTLFHQKGLSVCDMKELLRQEDPLLSTKVLENYRYAPVLTDEEIRKSHVGDLLHPVK